MGGCHMAIDVLSTLGLDLTKWEQDRPSWELVLMTITQLIATRSTCPRARCGAVVTTKDGHILATGYNGAPAGQPHCADIGCHEVQGSCIRAVHAETNAIAQAASLGIPLAGGILYSTHRVCHACAKLIVQAGVKSIIYLHDYQSDQSFEFVRDMLASSGVKLRRYR